MMNDDNAQNRDTLLLALDCWDKQDWDASIGLLKSLVDASYLPAFPEYRRMYVPQDQDNANLCIMLHGDREQEAGLSYSFRFRPEKSDPCITVRDEDFQCYRPFYYMIVHFILGLIDDNGKKLSVEINKWFNANCKKQFYPVYTDKKSEDDTSYMACARIQAGWTNIETWDIKYARRLAARSVIEREIIDNHLIVENDSNTIIIEERTD